MEIVNFPDFSNIFQNEPLLQTNSQKGLCRIWTLLAGKRVMEELKHRGITGVIIEASEVQIEPFLNHTFLRIIRGEVSWIYDGTGVGKFDPYFGPESDAPEHLRHHHPDMINSRWTKNSI